MKIIAYLYSDPLLEPTPDPSLWGWELDAVYQDLGGRHQLRQLLEDCHTEPVDYLLIRQLEELGDSVEAVSNTLTELQTLEVEILPLEGESQTSLEQLQNIQRYQRSRRIRQGHARNRLKATPPPGKAPYGYRRGKDRYILDRSAAPVVKDFFDRFLLYGSLHGAVRYLEKKYSKKISVSTGQRWLTNPAYRGDLAYQNGEVLSDTHTAILSREEAAQIDRLLRRNRRLPPRTASAPRSLAGLVVCGECQSSMTITRVTTHRQDKEYLYLRPISCAKQPKCHAVAYKQVLEQTIQKICQELPSAVAGMNAPGMDGIKQALTGQIASKQAILGQLPSLTTDGILDTETAELRAYKLRTEISQIQSQLSQLPPVNLQSLAQAVSIPRFWLDLSESERRFYFREFIRQVEIIDFPKALQIKLIFIFTQPQR